MIRHRLIGRQAILLRALAEQASRWVPNEKLAQLMLAGVDPEQGPSDEREAVHHAMHLLRRKLADEPVVIVSERYRGYRLLWRGLSAEGRKPDRASAGQAAPPERQPPAGGGAAREANP